MSGTSLLPVLASLINSLNYRLTCITPSSLSALSSHGNTAYEYSVLLHNITVHPHTLTAPCTLPHPAARAPCPRACPALASLTRVYETRKILESSTYVFPRLLRLKSLALCGGWYGSSGTCRDLYLFFTIFLDWK